jgi:hypothetical protein
MATAGVPSRTILAVHLQKCSHLSNETRVMQKKKEKKKRNANISVNEQPEWFYWAHRRWPLYAYLRHVHVLDYGHFTDIVSALAI